MRFSRMNEIQRKMNGSLNPFSLENHTQALMEAYMDILIVQMTTEIIRHEMWCTSSGINVGDLLLDPGAMIPDHWFGCLQEKGYRLFQRARRNPSTVAYIDEVLILYDPFDNIISSLSPHAYVS